MIGQLRYFFKKIKNRYDRIKCDSDQLKNLKKSLDNYTLFVKQNNRCDKMQLLKPPILCFGSCLNENLPWSNFLLERIKTPMYSFVKNKTCNLEIAGDIISYSNFYKPKIIFVNFANLLDLPDFTYEGLSILNYKQVLKYCGSDLAPLNLAGRQYIKEYFEINILFKFVQVFKLIEIYCLMHNICFFWYLHSSFIKALTTADIYHYFNTNTFISKDFVMPSFKSSQLFEQYLAEKFAKLYYESYSLHSENK